MSADILELFNQQKKHFNNQETKSFKDRKRSLEQLILLCHENLDDIHHALYLDLKKNEVEAYTAESGHVLNEAKLALKKLKKWMAPKKVRESFLGLPSRSEIHARPYGVTLIIAPWNYPFQLLFSPLVGALAAGNTAILKPSEYAPHLSGLAKKLTAKYFSPEKVSVVEGGVEETKVLLDLAFDKIFFTGGPEVGKIVMAQAAKHLTPVTLELGGKSPCFVWGDLNLDLVAKRIIWGKFYNCGQTCISPDYLLVEEKNYLPLVENLKKYINLLYSASPKDSADYGRIINTKHLERLKSFIDPDKILIGGDADEDSLYLSPTLVKAGLEDKIMQEEIFGPILPILKISAKEDALEVYRRHPNPLAMYLFSKDRSFQEWILDHTNSGGVCLNDTLMHVSTPHLPFGGVGQSGIGSYHGQASFEVFSHKRSVMRRYFWGDPTFRYPPYTAFKKNLIMKLFKWFS